MWYSGRQIFVRLLKLQIFSCAKSGVVLLNSNYFLIETLSKAFALKGNFFRKTIFVKV